MYDLITFAIYRWNKITEIYLIGSLVMSWFAFAWNKDILDALIITVLWPVIMPLAVYKSFTEKRRP